MYLVPFKQRNVKKRNIYVCYFWAGEKKSIFELNSYLIFPAITESEDIVQNSKILKCCNIHTPLICLICNNNLPRTWG